VDEAFSPDERACILVVAADKASAQIWGSNQQLSRIATLEYLFEHLQAEQC
jgi:hypothetical protein